MWVAEVVLWIVQTLIEFAVELGVERVADLFQERPLWERLLVFPALLVAILAGSAPLVFLAFVAGLFQAALG
jgi:hypothetical protein